MKWKIFLLTAAFALINVSAFAEVSSSTVTSTSLDLSTTTAQRGYTLEPPDGQKRWLRATGELVSAGWLAPWGYAYFVNDAPYSKISFDSIHNNFKNGFWWDRDAFDVNMRGHPIQGSIYFNAARVNGFNFWEAAPFTLVGDLGWEFIWETEPPAYNDLSNTFFGGMTRGEVSYRLSRAIIDNEATGWEKAGREVAAGILNPVGFLDRAVFGDMWHQAPNPPDRFPPRLFMMVDGGYQHDRESAPHQDLAYASITLRENDPHDIAIKEPFDYYDIHGTFQTPGTGIPAMNIRGLLAGWELSDNADSHQLLAPELIYDYSNQEVSSFGGQGLGLTLFSRWNLPQHFELRTEAGGQGFFAAGIQTDYSANSVEATGRDYDFGSGGGPKLDFRIRRDDIDWFVLSMNAGWFITHNGLSDQNRLFNVDAQARYPITTDLYGGIGWSLQDRHSIYNDLPSTNRTTSGARLFLSYAFRLVG